MVKRKIVRRLAQWMGLPTIFMLCVALSMPVPPGSARSSLPGDQLPHGCSLNETYALFQHFLSAFNRGDMEALAAVFPEHEGDPLRPDLSSFIGYTVTAGDPGRFATNGLSDLMSYFARRHLQQEHLALQSMHVVPTEEPSESVGVTFFFIRTAKDIPIPVVMAGKAGINCDAAQIWSLAMGKAGVNDAPTDELSPVFTFTQDGYLTSRANQGWVVVSTAAVSAETAAMFPDAHAIILVHLYEEASDHPMIIVLAGYGRDLEHETAAQYASDQ